MKTIEIANNTDEFANKIKELFSDIINDNNAKVIDASKEHHCHSCNGNCKCHNEVNDDTYTMTNNERDNAVKLYEMAIHPQIRGLREYENNNGNNKTYNEYDRERNAIIVDMLAKDSAAMFEQMYRCQLATLLDFVTHEQSVERTRNEMLMYKLVNKD